LKAKLETIPVKNRGVEFESETEEEKQVLEKIWNTRGGVAVLTREDDGQVTLVVAPTEEANGNVGQHLMRLFIKRGAQDKLINQAKDGGGFQTIEVLVTTDFELTVPETERKDWIELVIK